MSTMVLDTVMTERELAHQKYYTLRRFAITNPTKLGPVELPELPEGGERIFLSKEELKSFVRCGEFERRLDGNSIVTRLDKDTMKYAVDVVPLSTEGNLTEGSHEQH